MARHHATANGNVAFTAEEEAARDTEETAWTAGLDNRKAEKERAKRTALLMETDHYALTDVTMTDAVKTYRQALRDVPQQAGFPLSITWPDKPEI